MNKPVLTVFRGLPGSGKSTMAREMVAWNPNTIRVNRDDLRKMLHGDLPWSKERERRTVSAEQAIAENALMQGISVVVDDTNILGKGVELWQTYAAGINQTIGADQGRDCSLVSVQIKDLTVPPWAPIYECIRRDALREEPARVGRGVIERMALFGGLIDFSKEEKVAVIDIDGTLADLDHRLHFLDEVPKNYDGFFAAVSQDAVYLSVVNAVRQLRARQYKIIILSGRPTSTGHATCVWLNTWLHYDHLFMRQSGDHRPDDQVKRQLMEQMFKSGLRKDAIKVIIDDRDSVCAVWRELELPLIQVLKGSVIQIAPSVFYLVYELQIPINSSEMLAGQDRPLIV